MNKLVTFQEPLNSDDDPSDDEDAETMFEVDNVVVCQFEKVAPPHEVFTPYAFALLLVFNTLHICLTLTLTGKGPG